MKKADFYRDARRDLDGPLEGVRVLEVTTTWAGPMCGCILADFGADVVKIERPEGEVARRSPPFLRDGDPPISFMHATVNRNKRSLTLDLRHSEARQIFLKLVSRSDVVIENFRPGTLDGWGLGYRDMHAHKADLIYASISGWGQFGADPERAGYDPLAQAASGFLSLNGDPDGPPVKSPTFIADDLAGLHAALAVLAALRHRDRTGEGQHIDVSLLDAMWFQSTGYLTLGALGIPLPRMGNQFRIAAPASAYRAQDGWVMAGVLLDSQWRRLAAKIGHEELARHPDFAATDARLANRARVNALVEAWVGERSVADAVRQLEEAGVPAAPVRSYHEAAADPDVQHREMLQPTRQEDGRLAPITGPAAKFSRTPTRVRTGAPALGADTETILAELSVDEASRRRLRSEGAI